MAAPKLSDQQPPAVAQPVAVDVPPKRKADSELLRRPRKVNKRHVTSSSQPHSNASQKRHSSFPLLSLPREIWLLINDYLPFYDTWALRLSNSYFYAFIPPPPPLLTAADFEEEDEEGNQVFLGYEGFEATSYARMNQLFKCDDCGMLRHREMFSAWEVQEECDVGGNQTCNECWEDAWLWEPLAEGGHGWYDEETDKE